MIRANLWNLEQKNKEENRENAVNNEEKHFI